MSLLCIFLPFDELAKERPRLSDKAKSKEMGICIDMPMKPAALFQRPHVTVCEVRRRSYGRGSDAPTWVGWDGRRFGGQR